MTFPSDPVFSLRVDPLNVAHAMGQIASRGLDDQMIVMRHHTAGIIQPLHPTADLPHDLAKGLSVALVQRDIRPTIAPREGTWESAPENAMRSGRAMGTVEQRKVIMQDLPPFLVYNFSSSTLTEPRLRSGFFGQKPRAMFEAILDSVDLPPAPRSP